MASSLLKDYMGRGLAAARPVTPSVGTGVSAFYYATDTSVLSVWDGAAWDSVGGGGGSSAPWYFDPPLAADFTLANSGVGDLVLADDSDVGLTMVAPTTFTGSLNTACATVAVPAGDWTATMRMTGAPLGTEYTGMGMILRNAAGASYMFGVRRYGSGLSTMNNKWTSLSNFTANFSQRDYNSLADMPWRRIIFDSTTGLITFQLSQDGKTWTTDSTENKSVFFGGNDPTTVGIFAGAGGSGGVGALITATVDHWSVI